MDRSDEIRLIPTPGGWSWWSEVWLRSAGFPARLARDLGIAGELPFEEERRRISQRLREIAAEPRFREALGWQNRRVLHQTVRSLLKRPVEAHDSKTREYERVVTSYVHRYAGKNDTIGFFGPVAWAQLDEARNAAVELAVESPLLSARNTYLEHWGVDALARVLGDDPELRPLLAPRLHPAVRLEGRILHRSDGSRVELPEVFAAILERCDGRSAREIARELTELDADLEEEELLDAIQQLSDKRVLIHELEVPVDVPHPERALQSELERLPAGPARERSLAAVAELSKARDRVAASAGSPRLDDAIAELEATFERLTGAASVRKPGETYAGRTLVFEDCVRAVSCRLGRPFIEKLRPLELVLQSARWFTYEIASRYSERFRAELRAACSESGTESAEYLAFLQRVEPSFNQQETEAAEIVREVSTELQARWAAVLGLDDRGGEIRRSFAELEPVIGEAFAAPHPGWPMARFHSPDLLIDATSAAAFSAGDFEIVLGEVHCAASSLFSKVGVFQHPNPEALYERAAQDLPGPTLAPVESKLYVNRAGFLPLRPQDYQLETGTSRGPLPRERTVAVSELIVFEREGRLRVRTRDGRLELDLLDVMQAHLTFASVGQFKIIGGARHTPRVRIDGMVLARESWTFTAAEVPFLEQGDLRERFSRARTWRETHALPRFVFVRIESETKPFMVDLENPVSIDTLARRARSSSRVMVSEMLPDFDHLWLEDAQGERYTSELRLVVVDPMPMRAC